MKQEGFVNCVENHRPLMHMELINDRFRSNFLVSGLLFGVVDFHLQPAAETGRKCVQSGGG